MVTEIKSLIDDENSFVYLSQNRLDSLLSESEKKKDEYEEQMKRYEKTLKAKRTKKENLIDMRTENLITREEYEKKAASIDKEIENINELIAELISLVGYEETKNDTNIQISKLVNEGKAEGFNQELFNYIIDKIVVGGKRLEGLDDSEKSLTYVDDPKSLHFELNVLNLDTDMVTEIHESGALLFTEKLSENGGFVEVEDDDDSLYSLYSDYLS